MVKSAFSKNANGLEFCFLSNILGKKVYAKDGRFMGRLGDVIATVSQVNPEIEGIRLSKGGAKFYFSTQNFRLIDLVKAKQVTLTEEQPSSLLLKETHFLVREMLYDKQILDVNGAKVERVNDVRILLSENRAFIVDVDVGFTGLSRRLGFGGFLQCLAGVVGKQPKEELVAWKFVQPLPERFPGPIQVMLRQEQIKKLHPGELADIMEELDRDERLSLVQTIGPEDAADALEEANIGVQTSVLRDLDTDLAADILEEMEPAVAADVIDKLPADAKASIMAAMEDEERAQIEMLAQAEEDTAASLMTVDFISCPESRTSADALELLRENAEEIESITYVYCVDDRSRLSGVVSLRDLILSNPDAVLSDIMNQRLVTLRCSEDWETVAGQFLKLRFKALPVVDEDYKIIGIVTFQHSFDELLSTYNRLAD
jgi:magnesium transporter